MTGPDSKRVVQITALRHGSKPEVGSGYQITDTTILTASHILGTARAPQIFIQSYKAAWKQAAVGRVDIGGDISLLTIAPITAPDGTGVAPIFGALGSKATVLDATTA